MTSFLAPDSPSPGDSALEAQIRRAEPCLWINPACTATPEAGAVTALQIDAAVQRFARAQNLLQQVFPALRETGGRITSPLLRASALQQALGLNEDEGQLWTQCDHLLPVAGSVKARGAMHEVLEFAEGLAVAHGLIDAHSDLAPLADAPARALFAQHEIVVGSTGNLGMGVGLIATALGFRARVHMSQDAKAWKKARLRAHGVQVVEHEGDYERAVHAGREAAARDPACHFVDDEQSRSLLLGYSAAAADLQTQLQQAGVRVDAAHPLFVYLPCGVGGAPGGIALGLRERLGAHVHCFFVEPVQSPCMLVQLRAGMAQHPSVYDFGLNNRTEADGLAVPRASLLAAALMRERLAGVYTVTDDALFAHLARAHAAEGLRLEPSAAAGLAGPLRLVRSAAGRAWLAEQGLLSQLPQATHLAWTTGGALLPDAEFAQFLERGEAVIHRQAQGEPHDKH
jgi:D-serine dehydratase